MNIDILTPNKKMMSKYSISIKYGIWRIRLNRLIKEKKVKYLGKGFVGKKVESLYLDPGKI